MNSRERSNKREGEPNRENILLIVTGGIAAYKSAYLVRLLKRRGYDVRVVMSAAAREFVTPLTFEVLSGNPVPRGMFDPHITPQVEHVELAVWADAVVVAPATADFIAKTALGLADDLASTTVCAARCPVLIAPAMNEGMWGNPAVTRNIRALEEDGRRIIEPRSGELACGDTGIGRMVEPEEIAKEIGAVFGTGRLGGVRVLITAGRTEESIDPVRYISNRSSGRMGFALASAVKAMGGHVTLIHGPVDVPVPRVDSVRMITTAAQLKTAVTRAFKRCDVLFMAAAVSDYTPARGRREKLKRVSGGMSIELKPTADILASLAAVKGRERIVVGFALETGEGEANARRKIVDKGCDFLVLNVATRNSGFDVPTNQVTLFKGNRKLFSTPVVTKERAAELIVEAVAADKRLKSRMR